MSIAALFNKHVDVKRPTYAASDYSSSGSVTWAVNLSNVPCRIRPVTSYEVERFGRTVSDMSEVMDCSYGLDIKSKDQVTDGTTTWEVTGKPMDAAGHGHHLIVPLMQHTVS